MLNEKFNKNIIADAMRVLSGQTTEKKPLPQSLKDAAASAATSLRILNEGVVSIESRRDTLRKHLNEGVKGCGCNPTVEMITRFEEEVEDRLKEAATPDAIEEQKVIGPYQFSAYTKGSIKGWQLVVKGQNKGEAIGYIEKPAKITDPHKLFYFKEIGGIPRTELKASFYPAKENRIISAKDVRYAPRQLLKAVAMWMDKHGYRMIGEWFKDEEAGKIDEEIETGLRDFVSALTEEEIEILGNILGEAKMSDKKLKKAVNDAYNKYFDRVQVSMMELPKIYKEIEAAIVSGSDLDKVMPDLVKKYKH
jgi:hypothetical protein